MNDTGMSFKINLLVAALVGATFSYGVNHLITNDSDQRLQIHSLEDMIKKLKSSLERNEIELQNLRLLALHKNSSTKTSTITEICKQVKGNGNESEASSSQPLTNTLPSSVLALKNLETDSDTDLRSLPEKLNELLSGTPTKEKIAIASRVIFDKASDRQELPDYVLQSTYANQTDPDLKRVIAQVLSQRGNNTLLDNQIAEVQAQLKSSQPGDRQEALNQLAKMHSIKAVDAIAPLLQDPDTNVKLEALFALRDSGNQRHVGLVEMMVNDPDPSVSSLASDVFSNLKNLSASARTSYSRADIEAELPPIANP